MPLILTSLSCEAHSLVLLAPGVDHHLLVLLAPAGDHHLLSDLATDHHLLLLLASSNSIVGGSADGPTVALAHSTLWSTLLPMFSDQSLELLPGQLLVRGQDRPGLTVREGEDQDCFCFA